MSTNNHGLPSRVPVIAEMGRLFANPQVPIAEKRDALELLLQDHGDLDEVEAPAALWAINQLSDPELAREAWLGCATAWLLHDDMRADLLDAYQAHFGSGTPAANARWVLTLMADKAKQMREDGLRSRLEKLLATNT